MPFSILTFSFLLCTRSLINLVLIDILQLTYYLLDGVKIKNKYKCSVQYARFYEDKYALVTGRVVEM